MKIKSNKLKFILNLDLVISIIPLAVLVFITFLAVIMRYIIGNPIGWVEEIQMICIVWIIFAGGGAAFRTANHVAIEIIYDILPKFTKKIIDILIVCISIAVLLYLFFLSLDYLQLFTRSGRTTSILHIPYTMIYSIVPVSALLQIINIILTHVFKYSEEEEIFVE